MSSSRRCRMSCSPGLMKRARSTRCAPATGASTWTRSRRLFDRGLDPDRLLARARNRVHGMSASIETGALDNECLQGGRVDGVTLVEIDGTNRLTVQTRVEEAFRILQLGPFWKRQPHRVLEDLAYADDAVVGPDGHPLGARGFLPLHLFDYAGVGAPDQSPQLAQPLTSPAGRLPDDGIDLLGRRRVVHADALPRRLSTQRTEGLTSLSFRCVQPSQQHGRRL